MLAAGIHRDEAATGGPDADAATMRGFSDSCESHPVWGQGVS